MKPGYISIYSLRSGLYKIREAAERTGLTQRAIRYYESLGLLATTKRSRGKIRLYTEADCARLLEIKKLRVAGSSLTNIGQQLPLRQKRHIAIFVDSAFSVSVAAAEQYGVILVPDTLHFGTSVYQDYTTLAPEAFVGLEKRKRSFAVSEPPAAEDYVTFFSQALSQGYRDIVSLHPDQRLSRSYERACAAAAALPQLNITVLDTQLMSLGLHYILEKLKPEMSVSAIQAIIKKMRTEITEFVILGNLEHLLPAQAGLSKLLFSYVPILQHTAKDGLFPVARLDTLAVAVKYLNTQAQGFAQYRAGYSSIELYKNNLPLLKNISITTADYYSSVIMANFSSSLLGLAVIR